MPAYVVVTREKTRHAAELEQYKQLAPPSFKEHPAIIRAIHGPHRGRRLDAGIMRGNLDNMGAAQAGAPDAQLVRIDFELEGEPGQCVAIILHLIAG